MKVTNIKGLAHKPSLYRIDIDNKSLGYIGVSDISYLELSIGKEISDLTYEKLVKQIKYIALYREALRYADRRLRSKKEVTAFLRTKGSDEQTTTKIINRLVELAIIDEPKLAAAYIHDSKLRRPLSRRAITIKLRQKQLPKELIDRELNLAQSDQESLDLLIKKKSNQSPYVDNQPKLFRYLLRQGFTYEDIAAKIGQPKRY